MILLDTCEDYGKQHRLEDYFYVAPGVAGVGCTKCFYWEIYNPPDRLPLEITVYDENGSIIEHKVL